MKKHAAGFIFFFAIVTVFAVGYAVVRGLAVPDIGPVEHPDDNAPILTGGDRTLRVTQAIVDPVKKTLAFSLAGGDGGLTEIDLVFYHASADGFRFAGSEVVKLRPGQWAAGRTTSMIRYQSDRLGTRHFTDNLYVTAAARRSDGLTYEPVPFGRDRATAVLTAKN